MRACLLVLMVTFADQLRPSADLPSTIAVMSSTRADLAASALRAASTAADVLSTHPRVPLPIAVCAEPLLHLVGRRLVARCYKQSE